MCAAMRRAKILALDRSNRRDLQMNRWATPLILAAAMAGATVMPAAAAAAPPLYVSATATGNRACAQASQSNPFQTLAAALACAGSGTTINVGASGTDNAAVLATGAHASIVSSTIDAAGTEGLWFDASQATIANSIVVGAGGGTEADCVDLGGNTITDGGHNLIGINLCPTIVDGRNGDLAGTQSSPVAADLGPLSLNGASTPTEAPQLGSPAIDAGDANTCDSPPTGNGDQRGVNRQSLGRMACDIGAYDTVKPLQTLYVVATAGTDPTCQAASHANPFHTLAAAVACAPSGTQINLGAGTFTGQLTLSQNVILQGSGPRTIITGPKTTIAPIVTVGDERSDALHSVTIDGNGVSRGVVGTRGDLVLFSSTIQRTFAQGGGADVGIDAGSSGGNASVDILRSTITSAIGTGVTVNGSGPTYPSLLLVANSTIQGNQGVSAPGALDINGTDARVINSTIDDNQGSAGISAGIGLPSVVLSNSVVAGNGEPGGADCTGSGVASEGGNVVGAADSGCPNIAANVGGLDVVGTPASPVNPLLGTLASNGGQTQTMALLGGSPAGGHGLSAVCNASPISGIDQRGSRRSKTSCDSGSYDTGSI
jgi:hypothetical protein